MAIQKIAAKGAKAAESFVTGIDDKVLPGLCVTELSWTEGERTETEDVCGGKTQGKTRYGVYQEVTGSARVRKSFKDSRFVKGDFIGLSDPDLNAHYLKLMSTTDCASSAKAEDKFEVVTTSTTKSDENTATFTFTLRRQPDFQP